MDRLTTVVLVAFSIACASLVVQPVYAAPTEDTVAKCNDGRDNDRDGLIDEADPDCAGLTDGGGRPLQPQ